MNSRLFHVGEWRWPTPSAPVRIVGLMEPDLAPANARSPEVVETVKRALARWASPSSRYTTAEKAAYYIGNELVAEWVVARDENGVAA